MSAENPYQAPLSDISTVENRYGLELASPGKRLANFVIDMIAVNILAIVVVLIIGLIAGMKTIESMSELTGRLITTMNYFCYYVIMEDAWGRTFGKFITGTIVVDIDGFKPSSSQIIGRSIARFVPFDGFTFAKNTWPRWHDIWSNTIVVPVASRMS